MPDLDDAPPPPRNKEGFLPIQTNAFDRIFIGVVMFVAIHLVWMRFLEAAIPFCRDGRFGKAPSSPRVVGGAPW